MLLVTLIVLVRGVDIPKAGPVCKAPGAENGWVTPPTVPVVPGAAILTLYVLVCLVQSYLPECPAWLESRGGGLVTDPELSVERLLLVTVTSLIGALAPR